MQLFVFTPLSNVVHALVLFLNLKSKLKLKVQFLSSLKVKLS